MTPKKKIFTENQFKLEVIPLLKEGLTVPLTVSGGSMEPFLAGRRDTVHISSPSFPMKKGDIAFFERANGKIVMHRIYKTDGNNYYFVGDAQTEIEGPIPEPAIFGSVKAVTRKNKKTDSGFVWWFFEKVWIRMVPLRPICFRLYRATVGKLKSKA